MDEMTRSLHMMVCEIQLNLDETMTDMQHAAQLTHLAIMGGVADALATAEGHLRALGNNTLKLPPRISLAVSTQTGLQLINNMGSASLLRHPKPFGELMPGVLWSDVLLIRRATEAEAKGGTIQAWS